MTDRFEACREEARQHKGVWYDRRADKFVAEVYSGGERFFLGHFATASEAADAYAVARAEKPRGVERDDTFAAVFQQFLDTADLNHKGEPVEGQVLAYREQEFVFEGVVFRKIGKGRRPFYEWSSSCATCSMPYDTVTATSPAGVKGITRNCIEHRRGVRKRGTTVPEVEAPQEWIDAVYRALETLSVVADDFDLDVFIKQCHADTPGMPRRFNLFVVRSKHCPIVIGEDGRVRPRA